MLFKNKRPVLTETFCNRLEGLRSAVEVLTGQQTRFRSLDFNRGYGVVSVGASRYYIEFTVNRDDLVEFDLGTGWNVALIDRNEVVRVMSHDSPRERRTIAGKCLMRWVGRNATDRHEEPLDVRAWSRCAEANGLTLEQLLDSGSV